MKIERPNEFSLSPTSAAEETLRLVAKLPAPDGLVDRVQQKLRTAARPARVFAWPLGAGTFRYSAAMRGAAAAAIVLIVSGGGWSIYSHVQPLPVASPMATPARIGGGGFSSAGAMRTPDSPNGPVITHVIKAVPPAPAAQKKPAPAAHKHAKKHTKAVPVIAQPQ